MADKKEKEIKPIKTKNYIVLILIIVGTIITSFYILSWYKQYHDSKLNIPIISSVLSEVKYNELDNILKERSFLIVYTCTSSEAKCRNFEVKFNDYIVETDLADDIVYLNLGYDQDQNGTINKLYRKYKHQDLIKRVNAYPTIFIFSEGKIIDLLSPNNDNSVSIQNVKEFLEGYDF